MSLRKPFAANTASSLADHYDALAACVEKRPIASDEAEQVASSAYCKLGMREDSEHRR